ncbi:hypothetical protein [Rhodococcus erythropolis]|uniref:Uncharacterized protein n=1 Tax=Rhodococcus erythropolis TaxID=1833 RepID=A0A8I1D5H1_RHOER|nr:hypothetical protein [Rhodococcus erythropolis]MBH5141434.1 hypothetical protein [Rhodococcus erythropolis]
MTTLPSRVGLSAVAAAIPGLFTTAVVASISGAEPSIALFLFCAVPWMIGLLVSMSRIAAEANEKAVRKQAWEVGRPGREAAAAAAERDREAAVATERAAAAERTVAAERAAAAERVADQALFDDLVRDAHQKLGDE